MTDAPAPTSDYLRTVLDAVPAPIFVVDDDLRVLDSNLAGKQVAGGDAPTGLQRLCGEVLRCLHALESEHGCGTTRFCDDCAIRNTTAAVRDGNAVHRERADMWLQDSDGRRRMAHFLVTASPFTHDHDPLVLLILEDITEVVELRGILPICAGCKKVRGDDRYWEQVESYFGKHSDLRLSHGLCPECVKRLYPEQSEEILRQTESA